jgi:hypothetical protein
MNDWPCRYCDWKGGLLSAISWFNSRQGQETYHFSKASRPGLEYIEFRIEWFWGYLLEGK